MRLCEVVMEEYVMWKDFVDVVRLDQLTFKRLYEAASLGNDGKNLVWVASVKVGWKRRKEEGKSMEGGQIYIPKRRTSVKSVSPLDQNFLCACLPIEEEGTRSKGLCLPILIGQQRIVGACWGEWGSSKCAI
jgi:hypothetical protein